jgi:hypothetical protein
MTTARQPDPTIQWKKTPRCELLGRKKATHFLCRGDKSNGATDCKWLFVSTEAPELFNDYHFEIDDFLRSPQSTIDWLAHLYEKDWFNPQDFCAMMLVTPTPTVVAWAG